MKPNKKFITINNNKEAIKQLLTELVLAPRINAIKWSKITRQTPNIKVGYPGQHLASLITGITGEGTGARGNDLIDGSEVKSCSRIDQLDQCADCKQPVTRTETQCPQCNSTNITRKDDSKWLFTVKNEADLDTITNNIDRILLILGDYPNFKDKDYETIRFQAFEIWTHNDRSKRFSELISNYYYNIYLAHKKKNPASNPAPKNFWPYSYQFYLCNPILVFSCLIKDANNNPEIDIDYYLEPDMDRENLPSPIMPVTLLSEKELNIILKNASNEEIQKCIQKYSVAKKRDHLNKNDFIDVNDPQIGIDEQLRSYLPLRDTDKIANAKNMYSRRKISV